MLRIQRIFSTVFILLATLAICPSADAKLKDGLYARLETNKGEILIKLELKKTPLTVANFVGLAEGTIEYRTSHKKNGPYYDGLTFHRVIPDFMIQGGCPQGNGRSGPGYSFPDEFDRTLRHSGPGILSMANAGPGTNGSQFFITHTATPHLDGKHSVFGHVVSGMKVVNAITKGDTIDHIEIIRQGAKAKAFQTDQQAFNSYLTGGSNTAKKDSRLAALEALEEQTKQIEKGWPGAITTESGLRYIVKKKGLGGEPPKPGTRVTVHYTGKLLNGKKFDSSHDRGQPFSFNVGKGQVVRGWDEALLTMTKGEKRLLIIPPDLGYGDSGKGTIPPGATMLFDVELIDY